MEYLGHVISAERATTDPKNIEAIKNWPSSSLKELREFLRLIDYYIKFIKRFGIISKPLIDLLKKNDFRWYEEKHEAFDMLKNALCEAPVLAIPDFTKTFALETDACAINFRAVLSQEGKPLAFSVHYEKRVFGNSNGNR